MITPDASAMPRQTMQVLIAKVGGAYILPEDNAQPDPALRIASIRLAVITGIGATEAQAQADWFRQAEQAPE